MNEEIHWITNKRKMTKTEWENDDFDVLRALYSVYKKLGQFLLHTYSLTFLNEDASVLLKVINIWTSS